MKTGGDRFGVIAEGLSAIFDDLGNTRVTAGGGLKDDSRKQRHFHLIRCLRPANEFIKIVQRKRLQNFYRKRPFHPLQIVFAQDQAQRLNG